MVTDARAYAAAATVDSLVAMALRRAPGLRTRRDDIAAAREEAAAAGALPDPMVSLSARGEDWPGSGLGEDPMAMAALEFSQAIPWPGKRPLRAAAASAFVPVLVAGREVERRELAAMVREGWADLFASDAALGALRRTNALYEVLEPQALARYETGTARQSDWLALRREQALILSAIADEQARREALVARLAAVLSPDAGEVAQEVAVGEAALADVGALPPLPAAAPAADGDAFATVAGAAAMAEATRQEAAAARREGRPDLVVGAEYGWRDTLAPMVTARIGLEVPLWKVRRQDAAARAAGHREAAARAEARAASLAAAAEARGLAARRQAALGAAHRLEEQVLPLLELAAEGARARFLSADLPADELIALQRELAGARADLARAQADAYAADARLRALSGLDPVAGDGRETE